MIDFHSHILSGIDDGSASIKESLSMLSSYSERVTDVFLTPHFYPFNDMPDKFFERRNKAYEELRKALGDTKHPKLHLGAEVLYFPGINHSAEMENFKIEGTRLILIEMPQGRWDVRMMDELLSLNREMGLRPVLAHIDRYNFARGENREALMYFLDNRGLVQVNAEAFQHRFTKRRAIKMVRYQMIHFIGSDAHNTTDRKPNIDAVIDDLSASRASDVVDAFESNYNRFLSDL